MKDRITIYVDRENGHVDFNHPKDTRTFLYALAGLTYAAAQTFGKESVAKILRESLDNECEGERAMEERLL